MARFRVARYGRGVDEEDVKRAKGFRQSTMFRKVGMAKGRRVAQGSPQATTSSIGPISRTPSQPVSGKRSTGSKPRRLG